MTAAASTLSPDQIEAATACLRECPEVCAAYLHGSAVKGLLRSDSDVDIALLISPQAIFSPGARLDLAARMETIFRRSTDLGLLSTRNVIYAREVAEHGRLLFTRDRLVSDRFIAQALAMYADLQQSRKKVLDAYAA